MRKVTISALFILLFSGVFAQKQQYKVAVVGFYNLENLFDTIDNPIINDEEFLPSGAKSYNTRIYLDKLDKLSNVISQMGTEFNPQGLAILGVAEIENDTVLKDLVNMPLLKNRQYKIVHFDSRDARGIDVGLLYNPKYFTVTDSNKLFVQLPGGAKDAYFTRDILWVKGVLDGEPVHVYVNHWPSRSGGEERSAPAREAAAAVAKKHIDSIRATDPMARIILMGDLNDDPVNRSLTHVLQAKGNRDEVFKGELYNPWMDFYKQGIGTLAFQDSWNLFDQIIISYPWLSKDQTGFFFHKAFIFNREFMTENLGRYKGYPMRTWDGNVYRAGYSDHFPTYIVLLKRVKS